MKRPVAAMAFAIAVLSMLPACRSEGIGTASETLLPQVEGIRAAVEAGDVDTAVERLALLKIAAQRLRQEGALDEEDWQRVVRSADQVAAFLSTEPESQPGSDQLRVPLEDLNGPEQQAPAGAAGGRDGGDGDEGDDGEKGERGEKGNRGNKGKQGD